MDHIEEFVVVVVSEPIVNVHDLDLVFSNEFHQDKFDEEKMIMMNKVCKPNQRFAHRIFVVIRANVELNDVDQMSASVWDRCDLNQRNLSRDRFLIFVIEDFLLKNNFLMKFF